MSKDYHLDHPDDSTFDRVSIELVPRYKESGLSGDEWRVSAVTSLYRKNRLIVKRAYSNVEAATAHLPWLLKVWSELGDEESEIRWRQFLKEGDSLCHQPGCAERASVLYELKDLWDRRHGVRLEKRPDPYYRYVRAFCDIHKERGDCGLEDSDSNYIKVRTLL